MTSNGSDIMEVFFQSTPCLASHVHSLIGVNHQRYIDTLRFLCDSGTFAVVSGGVRARILAALHITSQHKTLQGLLENCEATDITKALLLLDRPRKSRQLLRKIQRIESTNPQVVRDEDVDETETGATDDMYNENNITNSRKRRRRKVDIYRGQSCGLEAELEHDAEDCGNVDCSDAHKSTAVKELIASSSVSGALARKVRNWVKANLKSDFLEFVLLAMPLGTWKSLADLVHFSPSDFALPHFLEDAHKEDEATQEEGEGDNDMAEKRTFVGSMKALVQNSDQDDFEMQFLRLAEEYPQVYLSFPFIRLQRNMMANTRIVEKLAQHVPLDTAIWYFEELYGSSRNCEKILLERLNNDDDTNTLVAKSKATTYGKLLERILTFRRMRLKLADNVVPLASVRLEQLKEYWKSNVGGGNKVAVFGDASSSMQRAIEAATIFASMVSACFDGELSFFASGLVNSPHEKPETVEQTLEVCDRIRASGCTSLAAALWPYYEKRVFMDMFVLVSDEEENTSCNGYMFAQLLSLYKRHVNKNVALVIVCVGKGDREFRSSLANHDIVYKTVYIDESRPDLAKFDALLGQLALVSSRVGVDGTATSVASAQAEDATNNDEEFVVV